MRLDNYANGCNNFIARGTTKTQRFILNLINLSVITDSNSFLMARYIYDFDSMSQREDSMLPAHVECTATRKWSLQAYVLNEGSPVKSQNIHSSYSYNRDQMMIIIITLCYA